MNQDLIDRAVRNFHDGFQVWLVDEPATAEEAEEIARRIGQPVIRDHRGGVGLVGAVGTSVPVTTHTGRAQPAEPTMQINVTFAADSKTTEVRITGSHPASVAMADRIALLAIGEPCSVSEADGVRTYKPNRLIDWKPVVGAPVSR